MFQTTNQISYDSYVRFLVYQRLSHLAIGKKYIYLPQTTEP